MSKQDIINYVMDTPHNINPAILNQKLGEMEVQPDWNQNDPKAPDYVKNRPFYEKTVETVLFEEHTANFTANEPYQLPPPVTPIDFNPDNPLFNGTTLRIVWDGVAYDCVTVDGLAGNGKLLDIPDLGNGEPFFFDFETFYVYEGGEHTYSVSIVEETIHKLDPKYIKDMYYTETVQKSETREFYGELVDAEFALLLFENRQTAKYVINGVQYTFEQDTPIPTGYLWSISSADGTSGTISIAGDNDVILATDATSITVNYEEEIIHKLDTKYLDLDWLPVKTEQDVTVLEEDMQFTGMDQSNTKISPEIEDGKTYTVLFDGETYTCVGYNKVNDVDGTPTTVILLGNTSLESDVLTALGVVVTDTNEPFLYVYLAQGDTVALDKFKVYSSTAYVNSTRPLKITGLATAHNKLPEEYLPESVESVIIRSCTAGSTKKFKLSVDDNGTISATEVT